VSNAAMLSAHKAGEGPILVAGSSDIRSRAGSVFQSKKRLHLRLETDLPDPTAARLGQMATLIGPEIGIDEFAAAAKSTGREVLSHLGSRFRRIYCAI
jgi:hypothetical protein